MADRVTRFAWLRNPLRCSGHSLPTELVFLAKLIALALLWRGDLPARRHLPYFEFMDWLGPASLYDDALRGLAVVGFVLLFFSPWVRSACAMLGLGYLVGLLGCRPCLSVAHTYAACVFLVLSLSSRETGGRLLRWQVVILYAGAAVNKAFDLDWWNGHYFDTLLIERHALPIYIALADLFPPLFLSSFMGISIIATQFAITVCFLVRRWWPVGVVIGVVNHALMSLTLGTTFGPFLFAVVGSYVAFRHWPEQLEVSVPDTPGSRRWRTWLERLDFDRALRFGQATAAESPTARLSVHFNGRSWHGFNAVRQIALYAPIVFFLSVPVLYQGHPFGSIYLVALLLFFNPFWGVISKRVA